MNLHTLSKVTTKSKKRLGQGHGSGRVKTAGRGTKGQKARHSIPLHFEGGALPLIKRLPFVRGKAKNFSLQPVPVIINLKSLQTQPKDTKITVEFLVKQGFVKADEAKKRGVKILGTGKLETSLVVLVPTSKSAQAIIEKAGGRVETTNKV